MVAADNSFPIYFPVVRYIAAINRVSITVKADGRGHITEPWLKRRSDQHPLATFNPKRESISC
jgi:hypothetical protein